MMLKKIALAVIGLSCASTFACTTIIVGKNASADGSILIGRNVDSGAGNHPIHFIKHEALKKGFLFKSVQSQFTYQMPDHLMSYTGLPDFDGKSQSYEEAGFNSAGVSMSATETIYSNEATLKVDPYLDKTGLTESEVTSILLPQIKSARQGVELLGKIIETQGSGEGFGIAFADQKEAWYLENAGGHQWVAVRIPDNMYFVSANQGRLREIDLNDKANVMSSKGLADFAVKNGLAKPRTDGKFDFFAAFTEDGPSNVYYNYNRVWTVQGIYNPSLKNESFKDGKAPVFLTPEHKLSVTDVESALQNHYQGTPNEPYMTQNPKSKYRPISVFRAQESHVLQQRANLPLPIANVEYLALGMTTLSIYVPFYQGAKIPAAYQDNTDHADSKSAWWKLHKLQTLAMQNFPKYGPMVESAFAKLNTSIQQQQVAFEKEYVKAYAKSPKQAQKLLDAFTDKTVSQVDALTEQLSNDILTQMAIDVNAMYLFHGA
ncbi:MULTISPECIES: C69 family dipeptidase [unclassified Paludibacterium]|uniref:C69 family dipeptidase n=1 Tax=unclassified Paludibacterium TaxID=2618429 RepID=UPI001C051E3A|nr:C69 family dipeptidase [Paludibacterium sp. B53371]BEV73270.1 C69 family dipeptidase [Paludibacterium sp. THUN1379]